VIWVWSRRPEPTLQPSLHPIRRFPALNRPTTSSAAPPGTPRDLERRRLVASRHSFSASARVSLSALAPAGRSLFGPPLAPLEAVRARAASDGKAASCTPPGSTAVSGRRRQRGRRRKRFHGICGNRAGTARAAAVHSPLRCPLLCGGAGEGRFPQIPHRVGIVMRGPEAQGSAAAPIGSFVQTAAGPFVSPAYAADCARFLAELKQRRLEGQDPPPTGRPA
jgi:hypothetical protein